MEDINISYEHLPKTPAIDSYIYTKFQKLEKFIHKDSKLSVKIVNITPLKKTGDNEYKILLDVQDYSKGRNSKITLKSISRDLYLGIDELLNKSLEKLRRNHEKRSNHIHKGMLTYFPSYIDQLV